MVGPLEGIDLGMLTERERQLLMVRHGLQGGNGQTLEECAARFDVSRTRVRQIELSALRKLYVAAKRKP